MDELHVQFNQLEMNALAFAVKSRLALIETRALSFHGETPEAFKQYLDSEWEYGALVSLCRKLHID